MRQEVSVGCYWHNCCSQGTPSRSPSICVPGQFLRKKVASAQDVICEQCVRPSQLKDEAAGARERDSSPIPVQAWLPRWKVEDG
jgi:hypothetical protein